MKLLDLFRPNPDKTAHKARMRRHREIHAIDAAWTRKQNKERFREMGHR